MNPSLILFISITVDNPVLVPHWGYFYSEPGVCWVAGAVTEPGWKCAVIDADYHSDAEVLFQVHSQRPQIVAFSCHTAGYPRSLRLAQGIKDHDPSVFCLFGGWHPSLDPDAVLAQPPVDAVGVGQGERIINSILRDRTSFKGTVIRAASQTLVERSRPFRGSRKAQAYFHFFGVPPLEEQRAATITLGSGGCSFRCTYCCTAAIYNRLEPPRPLDKVLGEIIDLLSLYRVNYIFIRDENPVLYGEHFVQFCDALIRTGINNKVRFYSFGDTRLMTYPLLQKMAAAGWTGLNYGVESFNSKQLCALKRSPDLDQVKNVFEWTRQVGIFATANIMLWQPGDGLECFKSASEAMLWLKPDEVTPLFYVPFPGTLEAARCANHPKRTNRYEDYHLLTPILSLDTSVNTETLLNLRREMLNKYYFSKAYADLIEFRKNQFNELFCLYTCVRRNRMLQYGIDIWDMKM